MPFPPYAISTTSPVSSSPFFGFVYFIFVFLSMGPHLYVLFFLWHVCDIGHLQGAREARSWKRNLKPEATADSYNSKLSLEAKAKRYSATLRAMLQA